MAERKTKKQMIQRILLLLEHSPRTINELAVHLSSNWSTINKNLSLLESIHVVESIEKEGQKYFKASAKDPVTLRDDTLYGIPINKKDEELCKFLFKKIKEAWIKIKSSPPKKTEMQKAVVEVANRLGLSIPSGWYIFGKMCILEYNPQIEYESKEIEIENLGKTIQEVVVEYSSCKNTCELMEKQYRKYNNQLYLAKLRFSELLEYDMNDATQKALSRMSYMFLFNFEKKEDNTDICAMIEAYISAMGTILLSKNKKEIESMRELLREGFISIWELIASYNLFDSLAEGNFGYGRDELRKYFRCRIETLTLVCEQYLEELLCYVPKQEQIDDNFSKFKGILKFKRLTGKERQDMFKEFEKSDTSNIFRELNLN